jgi:RHS repeat-associated protein
MLSVSRGHVVLRLLTILTVLTFFPSSVGAWTFTDQMREVVVREERDPLAELPWETVDVLERGLRVMAWEDDADRFERAVVEPFAMDDKLGSLFAEYEMSGSEPFQLADARTNDAENLDALRDEVIPEVAEDSPAATIPEDAIEQAIRVAQEQLMLAQAETDEDGAEPDVAAQLEQEASDMLDAESEEPAPSPEVERFILAQAETGDPWEGSTLSGPELLAQAQDYLDNGQPVEAALSSLELIDRFPGTLYAVGGNTIMNGLADEFRQGNISDTDVAAFEAAMPSFGQLLSLDGKYNILAFHRIKAKDFAKRGLHADGRAMLELCIAEAQELIEMDATNPLQIDIMKVFVGSAWEYSPTEGYAAADYLKSYIRTQPRNIGRWAAKYVLKKFQGGQAQDFGRARLAAVDLLSFALRDTYVVDAINDPTCYGFVKAALQYAIADCFVTRNRWQDALDKCDEIIQNYPSATAAESAALLKCYVARRMNAGNLYPAIVAYDNFVQEYPDSEYAKHALWMVGNLYFHSEDYVQAASYFRSVVTTYPGSSVALIAEDSISYINAYFVGAQEVVAEGPENREPWMVAQMCGPLALQKLLASQGITVDLKDIADRTGVNGQGTTMLALVETAKHYGVALTGVELATLESLDSPFIAYVNDDHFVLVKDIKDQQLTIADSWKADEVVLAQDFEKTWKGQALVIGPGPGTAERIDIAMLAQNWGGDGEGGDPPPDGEDASCDSNNNCDPPPPTCPNPNANSSAVSNTVPGGNGGRNSAAPGGPLGVAPIGSGIAGSPQSPRGGQTSELAISSNGVNARITNNVSALSIHEPDISIDVKGPMSLTFQRQYFSRRGYHVERRTGAEWYGNNIGSGWVHNWNYHIEESEGTEANGQPSMITVFADDGNTEEYEWVSRAGGNDRYEPANTQLEIEEQANVILRNYSTNMATLFTVDVLRLYFSAPDANRVARLETVRDIAANGNEMTLSYDGANGTGKLTKIDTPSGDARYLQLSYDGSLITKAELKESSNVLQEVLYAYDGNDELTKVTDDGGQDVQYAYDSDGTYTNSRFMTKITDKLGYEYDFAYTFKTHHVLTNWGAAYVVEVDYPNGLKTVYDRSNTAGGTIAITNLDGMTQLNKTVLHPGGTFFKLAKIDYYRDASNYDSWEFKYDSGVLTKILRPGGIEFATWTYNAKGRWSTHTYEDLAITWEYDSAEERYPTKRIEADGTETEYFYDANYRVTKVTHPSYGSVGVRYEYDTIGNTTKVIAPAGEATTMAYDADGNLTSTTNPLNFTTTFEYNDLGLRTKVTDHMNNDTEFLYDGSGCGGCSTGGNMTKVVDAVGNETVFEYDLGGRRTKVIDPHNVAITWAYDQENRTTKITTPGSANTTFAYDKTGRATKHTDFEGNDTTLAYNFKGQVTKQTDPIGDTDYTYDAYGNLSTLTDAENQVFKWFYDSNNRLDYHYDDEFITVHYGYDTDGRMTKTQGGLFGGADPTIYNFNNTTGLMTKVEYVSSGTTHDADYFYDDEGRVTKVADWLESGGNARLYGYDDAGRLTKVTEPDLKSITYSYDSANRITSINDYQSKVTSYTYTGAGRLSTIAAPGSKTWDYDYDDGFLTKYSHPNGMTTNYAYDDKSRLTKIEHKDGSTVKLGFTYTLDDNGNVTDVTYDGGETWEYFYDGRNRLTKAERDDSSAVLQHRYTYTYDDADNLLTKAVYDGTSTTNDIYEYNTANMLTKHGSYDLSYDLWGRLTNKSIPSVSNINYNYRYGGKLYSLSGDISVTYEYGEDGQRKSRTEGGTTTNYYYDGWNIINEKTGSSWTTNVFDLGTPAGTILADVAGDSSTEDYRYYAHDIIKSTRGLFSESKAELATGEFTPYGEIYSLTGSEITTFAFTGYKWDATAELLLSPYRAYLPGAGRWITRDPLGMVDGPNVYSYVGGNPSSRTDPLGLNWCIIEVRDPKTGKKIIIYRGPCDPIDGDEILACRNQYIKDVFNCGLGNPTPTDLSKCLTEAYCNQIKCIDKNCGYGVTKNVPCKLPMGCSKRTKGEGHASADMSVLGLAFLLMLRMRRRKRPINGAANREEGY